MLTKKVIDSLYKKYNSRPESVFDLDLSLLFDHLIENHGIELDEEYLKINSVSPDSPFHKIPLRHIHAIMEFADDVAVILPTSIIFMRKHDPSVNIHLKEDRRRRLIPNLFRGIAAQVL